MNNKRKTQKFSYRFKFILGLLSLSLLTLGLILVSKAMLDKNNKTKEYEELKIEEKKYNEYTSLDSINIKAKDIEDLTFGDDINSPYSPLINNKVFIGLRYEDSYTVGYLDKDQNFFTSYEIKGNIELIQLFENESIAYILKDDFGKRSLIVSTNYSNAIIYSFELGTKVNSFYFEPSEKAFYILESNINNEYIISQISSSGKYSQIFKTSATEELNTINLIDLNSNKAFISGKQSCFFLQFEDKQFSETKCNLFKRNVLDKKLSESTKNIEIIDTNNGNSFEIIKEKNTSVKGFLDSKFFIYIEIPQNLENSFKVKKLSLSNKEMQIQDITDNTELKSLNIKSVFLKNDKLFIISSYPTPKILLYSGEETIEEKDKIQKKINWNEVNINPKLNLKNIEILNSNPYL